MLLSYISRQDGLTLATQGYTKDPVSQSADSESKWSRTPTMRTETYQQVQQDLWTPIALPPCPL